MSFRLFVYYCALCGGWAAFLGWAAGLVLTRGQEGVPQAGFKGLLVGLFIALGLSLVDAMWNLSIKQIGQIAMRVLVSVMIGALGGLMGGMIGQALYENLGKNGVFLIVGWTLTGLLIGTSIGMFEWILGLLSGHDLSGAQKKLLKTLIGGTIGGIVGGGLALVMRGVFDEVFKNKDVNLLWSPWAAGFVALGACIGLLIGLAQVILKEAWIRVEAGFKVGREKILAKERTTVGRAEACDIGLFGDNAIERLHANIIMAGNRFFLEDAGTPSGTFLNERPVRGRLPLHDGDMIRLGRSVLRFRERQKR
jgi:hypothetical protein